MGVDISSVNLVSKIKFKDFGTQTEVNPKPTFKLAKAAKTTAPVLPGLPPKIPKKPCWYL